MKLYSNLNYIFIIWLLSVLSLAYLGFSSLPHSGFFNNNFLQSLGNWDGGHYLGIAKSGYSQKYQYAFFPFYPLLIKAVSYIFKDYFWSAILISIVATFSSIQIFYKLLLLDFNEKIAQKAVISFLLFPTSFFLLTAYTEGLFFFLVVLTFYLFRKNKLFWAMVTATLASATRPVGLALVATLIIEVIRNRNFRDKRWYLLFAPMGIIFYSIFLYKQTGNPLYFINAQSYWQRPLAIPGFVFWQAINFFWRDGINLIFTVFGLGFVIRAFRFLPRAYAFYGLFSIVIPLSTSTLMSIPRFLLMIFPIFILVALIKNHFRYLLFQISSLVLLAFFTILFITGYFIA